MTEEQFTALVQLMEVIAREEKYERYGTLERKNFEQNAREQLVETKDEMTSAADAVIAMINALIPMPGNPSYIQNQRDKLIQSFERLRSL